jgi:hypothetical protein
MAGMVWRVMMHRMMMMAGPVVSGMMGRVVRRVMNRIMTLRQRKGGHRKEKDSN